MAGKRLTVINVRVDDELTESVNALAQRVRNVSRSALVRELVRVGLETVGDDPTRLLVREPAADTGEQE